jgi:hypothetical protein
MPLVCPFTDGSPINQYAKNAKVLNGDSYDARADLYSTGTILYHMMTNGPPYKADSIKQLQQKLANPPKLHYPSRFSDELRAITESLLKVDPDDRITFAQFFGHPLFRGWPELATKASGVPYGDAPATPSPSSSMVGFSDGQARAVAADEAAAAARPVDDRSFVIIEKDYVELETLADDLAGTNVPPHTNFLAPLARAPGASSGGINSGGGAQQSIAEQLKLFTNQVEEITRRGSAVMSVANTVQQRAQVATLNEGSRRTGGSSGGDSAALTGPHADVPFKERVELLLLYHMAQDMFRKGLSQLLADLPRLRGELRFSPTGREAVHRMQRRLGECITFVEQLRMHLPPEIGQGGPRSGEFLSIHGVVPPEELIYLHALQVCKEAANAESERRDLGSAEALYVCALDLLEILRAQAEKDDAAILDGFINSTRRRLELVGKLAGKFAKAKAAARRIAAERAKGGGGGGSNPDSAAGSNVGSYSSGGGVGSYGHSHSQPQGHPGDGMHQQAHQQQQFRERASSLDTRARQHIQRPESGARDRSISFGNQQRQTPSPTHAQAYLQHQQPGPAAYTPQYSPQQQYPGAAHQQTPYFTPEHQHHQQQMHHSDGGGSEPNIGSWHQHQQNQQHQQCPPPQPPHQHQHQPMYHSGSTPPQSSTWQQQQQRQQQQQQQQQQQHVPLQSSFSATVDQLAMEYGQHTMLPHGAVPPHLRSPPRQTLSGSPGHMQTYQHPQGLGPPRQTSEPLPTNIVRGSAGFAGMGVVGNFGHSSHGSEFGSVGRSPPQHQHQMHPAGNISYDGDGGGGVSGGGALLYTVQSPSQTHSLPWRQSPTGEQLFPTHCPRCNVPFAAGQKYCAECGSPNTRMTHTGDVLDTTPPHVAELPPPAPFTLHPIATGQAPSTEEDDDLTPFTDMDGAAAPDMPFGRPAVGAATAAGAEAAAEPLPRPVSADLDLHKSVTVAKEEKAGQQAEVERLKEEVLRLQMLMSQSSNDGSATPHTSTDA